jgi:hypothetical protein
MRPLATYLILISGESFMWQTLSLHNSCERIFALLALVATLAGCAGGLSKQECDVADWRSIGYEDGVKGWSQTRIGEHRKACARHGVALDLDAYRSGWGEGVQRYCQPGNGYHEGRTGRKYAGVCPPDLESAFLNAYHDGRELYGLEAKVRKVAKRLQYDRARLTDIEVAMRDTGLELVAPGVITERRVVLLDELRQLGEERAVIRAEIPALEAELESHKQRLAIISAQQDY